MRQYTALIHKDAGSDYGVSFPDLPGCVTAGVDLDDARGMAEEALALHLAGMAEDDEPIREPSSLEAVMADWENRDAVAILVRAPRGDHQSSSGQHDECLRTSWMRSTNSPPSTATPGPDRRKRRRLTRCAGQSGAEADRRGAAKGDRVGEAFFKLRLSIVEPSRWRQQNLVAPPTADCGRSPRRDAHDEP